MKLRVVLALAAACLVATNSHSQPQLGPAQNEQAGRQAAKRQLSQVLERDPNNKEALFGLGRLMADKGDFASARSLFARYVVISPTEPAAWAYLMRCAVGRRSGAGPRLCAPVNDHPLRREERDRRPRLAHSGRREFSRR